MGFADIFLGAKPKYQLLPGMDKSISDIGGMNFDLGYAGHSAKRNLQALNEGQDVSDTGAFAPIRQEEAADLQGIDEDYSFGGNRLIMRGGGTQANQLNRMRDLAKTRRREQTGRQYVNAMDSLRQQETGTLMRAGEDQAANQRWQQEALLRARSNVFDDRRSGGILNTLIQGAATVGAAALRT